MNTLSHTIGIDIARHFNDVYAFAQQPQTFARWASGLGGDLQPHGRHWRTLGPEGWITVRFSPPNQLGVLDHWVRPDGKDEIYIPLRAIPHGDATHVMLTLFRTSGMSDEVFARDAAWVRRDLETLKHLLETRDAQSAA